MDENPYMALDAGLLLSTDSSPLDRSHYDAGEQAREALIQQRALASTRLLVSHLRSALPIIQHPDLGPLAALPAPQYPFLPREKPLPKPKPETKWEKFAKRKGIANTKKDKLVWDDETKEWVPKWGYKGKNKKEEDQWIHELPQNAEEDFNPVASLRKERKQRNLHNKGQQLKNIQRAGGKPENATTDTSLDSASKRKLERQKKMAQLDTDVRQSKASTASMGRFDRNLRGEEKEKGLKRKFQANEVDASQENKKNLALLDHMNNKQVRTSKRDGEKDLVNARKAVRFASNGKGSVSLASKKSRK